MFNMELGNQLRMAAEDYKQMFAISLLNFTSFACNQLCKMGLEFSLGHHGVLPEV